MSDCELKQRIGDETKSAMRARAKERLGVLRLIGAALKQVEVDRRIELTDPDVLGILDKMVKQRRDSIAQYEKAERNDLADKERAEIEIIQEFLPRPLSEEELEELVRGAIEESGAGSPKEMGKVMAILKPRIQGRCDMGAVSARVKDALLG